MRDPNRIEKVLTEIGETWKRNPDLRLGQLICNVYRDPTLYYIEDDKLAKGLSSYYRRIEARKINEMTKFWEDA